jgi:hypothetical protein
MKRPLISLLFVLLLAVAGSLEAQKRPLGKKTPAGIRSTRNDREISGGAIVIDERLAVLRRAPSLFAPPVQRMRRGRSLIVSGATQADGITFYRVAAGRNLAGWMQKDALAGKFGRGDERLLNLIQASDGFDKIERARLFLDYFAASPLRPSILLLFGDLVEETALKISTEAARRLSRREMAASGAPLHSFFLNYASLDRYRRLGIVYLFNPRVKNYHYDGAAWREIVEKYPLAPEAAEARRRLEALKEKMKREN